MWFMCQNLILALWGSSTAVIQILLCSIRDCISPSSCLAGCFRKPFPLLVTFLGLSFVSEAPTYISTCIFIQELLLSQGSAHGAVCEHFVTGSSSGCLSQPAGSGSKTRFWFRPEAQCALVPQLEYLGIFSREMQAVQRLHGCRQGLPCVCGELVLKTFWFLRAGGTGAVIKYECSDFTVWPGSWRREISVIRSNCCG